MTTFEAAKMDTYSVRVTVICNDGQQYAFDEDLNRKTQVQDAIDQILQNEKVPETYRTGHWKLYLVKSDNSDREKADVCAVLKDVRLWEHMTEGHIELLHDRTPDGESQPLAVDNHFSLLVEVQPIGSRPIQFNTDVNITLTARDTIEKVMHSDKVSISVSSEWADWTMILVREGYSDVTVPNEEKLNDQSRDSKYFSSHVHLRLKAYPKDEQDELGINLK